MNHNIDATGKSIGRVATLAASFLMGKNTSSYKRNVAPDISVKIENASKAKIGPQKEGKKIKHYTGYPGGLREESVINLARRLGYKEVFKHAVKGMLPKNKLQAKMMKRLIITD